MKKMEIVALLESLTKENRGEVVTKVINSLTKKQKKELKGLFLGMDEIVEVRKDSLVIEDFLEQQSELLFTDIDMRGCKVILVYIDNEILNN